MQLCLLKTLKYYDLINMKNLIPIIIYADLECIRLMDVKIIQKIHLQQK